MSTNSKVDSSRQVICVGEVMWGRKRLKIMHLVFWVFRRRWRLEKACWTLSKLFCKAVRTQVKQGPDVYRIVSSAYRWIDEPVVVREMLFMKMLNKVGPRMEP